MNGQKQKRAIKKKKTNQWLEGNIYALIIEFDTAWKADTWHKYICIVLGNGKYFKKFILVIK